MNSKEIRALIKELRAKLRDVRQKMLILDESCVDQDGNRRPLNDEERRKINEYSKDVTGLEVRIEHQEELLQAVEEKEAAEARATEHATQIEELMKAESERKAKEEEEKRARVGNVETATQPSSEVTDVRGPSSPFSSLGEQLRAIHAAANPDQADPQMLVQLNNYNRELRAATGLGETVPSDGGYLLNPDYSTSLLKSTYEQSRLASYCRSLPIGPNSNGIKLPVFDETSRVRGSRLGGVRGYWTAEAAAITASQPKFRQFGLELEKLAALVYSSNEMLQDSVFLESVVQQAVPEELAFELDDRIIRGTGAGEPLGILNSSALVTVSKEAGQSADTVVAENLAKMWGRCYTRSREKAVWLINQSVEPQLMLLSVMSGTSGYPVYLPPGGWSQAPYATLFGRPVLPIEQASALGDVGDVILAAFDEYVLIRKGGLQSASSIHVRFVNDESVFRFVLRINGGTWWKSALTPAYGTDTLSPFVVLEAR